MDRGPLKGFFLVVSFFFCAGRFGAVFAASAGAVVVRRRSEDVRYRAAEEEEEAETEHAAKADARTRDALQERTRESMMGDALRTLAESVPFGMLEMLMVCLLLCEVVMLLCSFSAARPPG